MLFTIAFRNILRNGRRSAATILAVAVGAVALLLFGAFQTSVFEGLETNAVQSGGHLTVFHRGYFLFGAGNPSAYGIDDYQLVMRLLGDDPVLQRLVAVETPILSLSGIAGNFTDDSDASKTFIGIGIVPSDRERMRQWNEYGAGRPYVPDDRLTDADISRGLIGAGMARMLNLCGALAVPNCPAPPRLQTPSRTVRGSLSSAQIADLVGRNTPAATRAGPRIDLLAATAGGAPNVVTLEISGLAPQIAKELDDSYVAMNLHLAQQLVYGRAAPKVTGIVLQLHRSQALPAARERLNAIIASHQLPLEVRDFAELNPFYVQVRQFFGSLFLFIAAIMGAIVLFAVANTMTMAVMERTAEIGTVRAMGVRRSGIRRQFLVEGALLGAIGATLGALAAFLVVAAVNAGGVHWTPPGNSAPVPLQLALFGHWALVAGVWLALVLVATLAALAPAARAARLRVVEALHHA